MNYGFHPESLLEYSTAIRHYNDINPKLAEGFLGEVEHAIRAIGRNPNTWRIVEGDVRRYLVHRFP